MKKTKSEGIPGYEVLSKAKRYSANEIKDSPKSHLELFEDEEQQVRIWTGVVDGQQLGWFTTYWIAHRQVKFDTHLEAERRKGGV